MLFHTYDDFLLIRKHSAPKKGDYIQAGDSLYSYSSDLQGYMAYLKNNAPDLEKFFITRFKARIPEVDRKRHSYILGKSGSGKSELLKLFIYSYLKRKNKVTQIILDPHGDMAEEIARFKEFKGSEPLIYIDPFLDPDHTPTINPFQLKNTSAQNIDITAQALLGAFKEILKNTTLTLQMEALLIPCISVILKKPESTLIDLQRFMNDKENEDLVALGCRSTNLAHKGFFKSRFYGKNFDITKASISTKIQSLINSQVFYNLIVGQSKLDIDKILNSKKTVIFNLSKGKLGGDTSQAYGRFIVALIQSSIFKRAQENKKSRVPVHLYIDEFQNYISPSIEDILAESRKYGLHLTMAQQFLGQKMDTSFRRGILTNTQIKITGMTSNDNRTAISKEIMIDEKEIEKVRTGQFWVKVGSNPAFKLYAPTFLLGNSNAMPWDDWKKVKNDQVKKYYHCLPGRGGGDNNKFSRKNKDEEIKIKSNKSPKFQFDD